MDSVLLSRRECPIGWFSLSTARTDRVLQWDLDLGHILDVLFSMSNDFFRRMSKMLVDYVIGNFACMCMILGSGRDILNHIHAWTHTTWNKVSKGSAITVCHHKVFHVAVYFCTWASRKPREMRWTPEFDICPMLCRSRILIFQSWSNHCTNICSRPTI